MFLAKPLGKNNLALHNSGDMVGDLRFGITQVRKVTAVGGLVVVLAKGG